MDNQDSDKLSIEDKMISYISLSKNLHDDNERKKKQLSDEFNQIGEKYLNEIERKQKNKEQKKSKLISYIIKRNQNKYTIDELTSYSFEDIENIYNEIKKEKNKFMKFIQFILNIE